MMYENYYSTNNLQSHGTCSPTTVHQENVPITPSSSNSPISYTSSFEGSNESLTVKKSKIQRRNNKKEKHHSFDSDSKCKAELNDTPNSIPETQSFNNYIANNNSASSPLSESQTYFSEVARDDMSLTKSHLEASSPLYQYQADGYNNFGVELSSINTIFNTNQALEPKLAEPSHQHEFKSYQPFHQSLSVEAYNPNASGDNLSYTPILNTSFHAYQTQTLCPNQYQIVNHYHNNQQHEYFHSHDQNMHDTHDINYMAMQPVPDETINYTAYTENDQCYQDYNSGYYHSYPDNEHYQKKNQGYLFDSKNLTPDLGSDIGGSDDESLFDQSDSEMKFQKKGTVKNKRKMKKLEDDNPDDMSSSAKRKRKRILNRLQRAEATMREKRRMLKLNKAFEDLREVLPIAEFAKNKLSRAETLKSAIEYIEKMSEMLSIY